MKQGMQQSSKDQMHQQTLDARWNDRYEELKDYRANFNHCKVPQKYEKNLTLGSWVNTQRQQYRRGNLSQVKIDLLNEIGFDWGRSHQSKWMDKYEELKKYYEMTGSCQVPVRFEDNPSLGTWVSSQRKLYQWGELQDERVERLNEIGFEWSPNEAKWEEFYQKLLIYYQTHQTCKIKEGDIANKPLAAWINNQRMAYRNCRLSKKKIRLLEQVGMDWGYTHEDRWGHHYQQLKSYQEKYGNCRVSIGYRKNPALGHWVSNQRKAYRIQQLAPDRIALLNEIGFDWGIPQSLKWEMRYLELKTYWMEFNHCNVPIGYEPNPYLGTWVNNQRQAYRKGCLKQERIDLLNALNFDWRR